MEVDHRTHCSFCAKEPPREDLLVGPGVSICRECGVLVGEILAEGPVRPPTHGVGYYYASPWPKPPMAILAYPVDGDGREVCDGR